MVVNQYHGSNFYVQIFPPNLNQEKNIKCYDLNILKHRNI